MKWMIRYERDKLIERIAIWIAWRLPRVIAQWAYIRVATSGCEGNPAEQRVITPLERWG